MHAINRQRPPVAPPANGSNSAHDHQLQEKEAFNFALFQHNPLPMVVVDQHGHVLKSNLARRALNAPLPNLGAPLFDAARGEQETALAPMLTKAMAARDVAHHPDVAWHAAWYNVTIAPLTTGAVVILEDITERKHAQADAARRQQQLIQADKMVALGNLVSGVAHEISNPNNALLLSSTALERICNDLIPILDRVRVQEGDFDVGMRSYSEIREELPELVQVLEKAAQRIKGLVDDLKSYARQGSEILTEAVDVNATLQAAANLMHPLIRKATQRFTVEKAASLPTVIGNKQRIEQVLINLLSNACQALGSPQAAIVASTRWDADTGYVEVAIRDEGRGIAPEDLARITDPFFTTRKDDGGTGLGLSISRTIVENHKGQLVFTSEVGKGTVATVRLPVRGERAKDA
ncbi:MAG: ATP-binding protein [Verrucomicrobia bacterium]|nr:ATP-binding protein [Verrucomicrobiota bacterium]